MFEDGEVLPRLRTLPASLARSGVLSAERNPSALNDPTCPGVLGLRPCPWPSPCVDSFRPREENTEVMPRFNRGGRCGVVGSNGLCWGEEGCGCAFVDGDCAPQFRSWASSGLRCCTPTPTVCR
jgi:hypothetical protein